MGEVNQCKVHSYAYEPPLQSPARKASSSNPYLNGSDSWGSSSYRKVEKPGLDILVGCSGSKDGPKDKSSVGCEDSFFDEIQDAVDSASDGDVITVCAGTYMGFETEKSLTIQANGDETPEITHNPSMFVSRSVVSISNNATVSFQFTLDGFIIHGDDDSFGIYVYDPLGHANIILSNLDVYGSETGIFISSQTPSGDAVYDSLIILDKIILYQNSSMNIRINGGGSSSSSIVTLSDVEAYESNEGIRIYSSNVEAGGLNIHDNEQGIYLDSSDVSVSNSNITENGDGWAIYVMNSVLTLTGTSVTNNESYVINDQAGALQLYALGDNTSNVTAVDTYWDENMPHDVSAEDPNLPTGDLGLTYNYDPMEYPTASFYCEYGVGCFDE